MNDRVQFTINDKSYTLYFGMEAVRIHSLKLANELAKMSETLSKNQKVNLKTITEKISSTKAFSWMVYGGLCNYHEIKELPPPTFEEAYLLTEQILNDPILALEIETCFVQSRATKDQLARLETQKKSAQVNANQNKKTGMKSKALPLVNSD